MHLCSLRSQWRTKQPVAYRFIAFMRSFTFRWIFCFFSPPLAWILEPTYTPNFIRYFYSYDIICPIVHLSRSTLPFSKLPNSDGNGSVAQRLSILKTTTLDVWIETWMAVLIYNWKDLEVVFCLFYFLNEDSPGIRQDLWFKISDFKRDGTAILF